MGQTLDILIRIKQAGEQAINDTIKRLKELQKALENTQIAPVVALKEEFAKVGTYTAQISKDVNILAEKVVDTVDKVGKQAQDRVASSAENVNKAVSKGLEITLARAGFLLATIFGVQVAGGVKNLGLAFATAGELATKRLHANLVGITDLTIIAAEAAAKGLFSWERWAAAANLFFGLFKAGVGSLIVVPFLLNETYGLVRRLIGASTFALTPLEHASRLVSTIDSTLASSFITSNRIVSMLLGSGLSIWLVGITNSLLLVPTFINMGINFFLAGWHSITNRILASLGSGRAAFFVILFDLRKAILHLLPAIKIISKEIDKLVPKDFLSKIVNILSHPFQTLKGIVNFFSGKKPTTIFDIINQIKLLPQYLGHIRRAAVDFISDIKILRSHMEFFFHLILPIRDKIKELANGKAIVSYFQDLRATLRDILRLLTEIVSKLAQASTKALVPVGAARGTTAGGPKFLSSLNLGQGTKPQAANLARDMGESLQVVKGKVAEALLNILNLKEAAQKAISTVGGKFALSITDLGKKVERFVEGSKVKKDSLAKSFSTFFAELAKFQSRFGTGQLIDLGKLTVALKKSLQLDPETARKFFEPLKASLEDLEKRGIVKGGTFGSKLSSLFIQGLKGKQAEVDQAVRQFAELIESFFPQSLPKRGPLRNIVKSGSLIPVYIGQGIKAGIGRALEATHIVAEKIAQYFPRSLPIVGPLIDLVKMGFKIPFYLGLGIKSGITTALDAVKTLADKIFGGIETATEARAKAIKIGISVEKITALDSALKAFGSGIGDAEFSLIKLNEVLSKGPYSEEADRLRELGISFSEVQNATDPALALFLKLSDALKDSVPGTDKYRIAMELLGATTHSNLIIPLKQGSAVIKEEMADAIERGVTVTTKFANLAAQFTSVFGKVKSTIQSLVIDVLTPILPKLNEITGKILVFIKENRTQVSAVLQVVGAAAVQLISIIEKTIVTLIKSPREILPTFQRIASAALGLIGNILSKVWNIIAKFLVDIGAVVVESLGDMIQKAVNVDLVLAHLNVLFRHLVKWFWDLIAEIGRFLGAAIGKIPTGVSDFLEILIGIFVDIGTFVKQQLERLFLSLFAWAGQWFKQHGKIADALKFIGLGGMVETFKDFDTQYGQIQEKLDVKATKTGEIVARIGKAFSGFIVPAEVDKNLDQALANLKKTNEKFQGDLGNLKESVLAKFSTLGDKLKENIQGAFSVETLEKFRADFDKFIEEIKASFKSLPPEVRKEVDALIEILSNRYYNATVSAIEKEKAAQTKGIEDTTKKTKEQTQQSAGWFAEFINKHGGAMREMAGGLSSMFGDLFELSKEQLKEFFFAQKAAAIAEAIINTAQGITKGIAEGGILGIAQAAIIGAAGAVQIAKIMAQTLGFAAGGPVLGGSGTRDDVPALLQAGEYVQPVSAVRYYGTRFMEAVKQQIIPRESFANLVSNIPSPIYRPTTPTFQAGGLVSPAFKQNAGGKERPVNIVNFVDKDLMTQYLASSAGQQVLLNVLGNNRTEMKRMILEA